MELKDVKIGMRVVAIASCGFKDELIGKRGTVRAVRAGLWPVGVEFDEPFRDGHTLNGLLPDERPHGRWCEVESLMPCDEVDITIRSNGKKTTIKGEINGRKVDTSVRCSKKDTPNVYVGSLMALNKAFGVHHGRRAKDGETVIVINPIDAHNNYSLGDVAHMENEVEGTLINNATPVEFYSEEYAIIDDISILSKPYEMRFVVCVAVDKSGSPFVVGNVYVLDQYNAISLVGGKVCIVHETGEHWVANGKNKFIVINEDGKNKD